MNMHTMSRIGAALLAALCFSTLPACSSTPGAADTSGLGLDGTWIQTEQIKDFPKTELHFKGKNLRFKNLFGASATVEYQVREKNADGTIIFIEYVHKVKRGNDRVIERRDMRELLLHVEDGRPILSETEIEFDGRGPIILREFLRKQDFIEGFQSERKRRLNGAPSIPTMMPQE